MEWYFIECKEQMYDRGLTIHRKILPNDDVLPQSLRFSRKKIAKNFSEKNSTKWITNTKKASKKHWQNNASEK